VIHDNSLVGPLVATARSSPTVVTAHGPVDGEFGSYYDRIAPGVTMVSISQAQQDAAPHLPWIRTIYNAVPVSQYPFETDKDDYALFLGRMNPTKGVHIAIDIAKRAGIPLRIAAKCSEPEEHRYFEEEVAPRLDDGIEWIGEVDGPAKKDLLKKARCLLFPIQWEEPFGIVMVEAMTCGTPVVALRRGSVEEVVEDGLTGFIGDEPDELVDLILKVDEIDPKACRSRVEELFGAETMVEGYIEVFEQVQAHPNRR
jgi:glycosyltransferase involved in cell wall biosynthesis